MHGVLIRREFWCFLLIAIMVWIPYILHAVGVASIAFLLNPFTVFFIMFFALLIAVCTYIPKNPYMLLAALFILALIAFIYVWALYITPMVPIPVIPVSVIDSGLHIYRGY